jgi:hypothetical protein
MTIEGFEFLGIRSERDHSTQRRVIPHWPNIKLAIVVPLVFKTVNDRGQLLDFKNYVRLAIELSSSATDNLKNMGKTRR